MAGKQRYTIEQMEQVLRDSRGLLSPAARRLGCDRATMYNYAARYPRIQQTIDDAREQLIDSAESKLAEAIETKAEPWAIAFVLKTLGKHRGYTERTETDVTSKGEPLSASRTVFILPAKDPAPDPGSPPEELDREG